MKLGNPNNIEKSLIRTFWYYADGLPIYKKVEGNYWDQAFATNCAELLELSADGYYAFDSGSIYYQSFYAARCRAIHLLGAARPAETSYLRDFSLTPESVAYLPAMVSVAPGCARFCRYVAANEDGVPLSEFQTVHHAEVVPVDAYQSPLDLNYLTRPFLIVWTAGWKINLEIVGRGDFDGDGVDDVLLLIDVAAMAGRQTAANVFVLTRDRADAVLRVVDGDHDRWVLDTNLAVCAIFPCGTRDAHK